MAYGVSRSECALLNSVTSVDEGGDHGRTKLMGLVRTVEFLDREGRFARNRPRVEVLGGFRLLDGGVPADQSSGSERILALLALRGRMVKRAEVAGNLWPEVTQEQALTCLRSAICRLRGAGRRAVQARGSEIGLADGVSTDLGEMRAVACQFLDPLLVPPERAVDSTTVSQLSSELLPGWYDDWVVSEAEEWRQLRLHALEAMAGLLSSAGRFGMAALAAVAAIKADPLRESAFASLIRVHLAEHNQSEAIRQFRSYESLLAAELGLTPSGALRNLVNP
jgi:SARP family transcriptional regulator, regulator of embCAB operon